MKRRDFIRNTAIAGVGMSALPSYLHAKKNPTRYYDNLIVGHGDFKYKVVKEWADRNFTKYPVNDCHEMVMTKKKQFVMITNEIKNNILFFNKDGKVINSWGHQFRGGHGLTLATEGKEEFLFITDYKLQKAFKTTLDGKILMTIDKPIGVGQYTEESFFKPTEVAVNPHNGDFYICDGYALQHIIHYDYEGRIKNIFGGIGEDKDGCFTNAHGLCFDERDKDNPVLLCTDRKKNKIRVHSLEGKLLQDIHLPGASINRGVIKGENLYFSVLSNTKESKSSSGFLLILDKNNKVVSVPGANLPEYDSEGVLGSFKRGHDVDNIFIQPHDVCIDDDENIYVPQWASGKTYPIKLERI